MTGRAPSFLRTALQPRWLALLVACLAVAAAFFALGRWQLDAAIASANRPQQQTPDAAPQPLADHLAPQQPLYERSIGAQVAFEGILDPADLEVLDGRLQGDRAGAWVIGRVHVVDAAAEADPEASEPRGADAATSVSAAAVAEAPGMPVAVAWAPDAASAQAAIAHLREELAPATEAPARPVRFAGTLEYGQAPSPPDAGRPADALGEMAPAYLVNRWSSPSPSAYNAYVTLAEGVPSLPAGAEPIQRQVVDAAGELNWLNIFYAIEWAIFAAFALYLWWRMVRDEQRGRAASVAADPADRYLEDVRRERLRAIRDARRDEGATLAVPARGGPATHPTGRDPAARDAEDDAVAEAARRHDGRSEGRPAPEDPGAGGS